MAITAVPTRNKLDEALVLADQVLQEIELSEVPLSKIMLKASRLARLMADANHQLAFEYEASGYPNDPDGISADIFAICRLAGRVHSTKEKDGSVVERASVEAVEAVEQRLNTSREALEAARDPNVSISSSNPNQWVANPPGNAVERGNLQGRIANDAKLLAARRGFVHRYVTKTYDELRFSGIADDIFSRMRVTVDSKISDAVPKAVQKFASVYENLRSDNPEDWANAVHSCRRILQDLADTIFPPSEDRIIPLGEGTSKAVKLGVDNYINRLICFIEDHTTSDRYKAIVGSTLAYMGDRLDAAFKAAQKGSHAGIASREEADRYVVYTYMLVADIISLSQPDVRGPVQTSESEGVAKPMGV